MISHESRRDECDITFSSEILEFTRQAIDCLESHEEDEFRKLVCLNLFLFGP